MAKRWSYVRAALVETGLYSESSSLSDIVLDKIELVGDEYYVFYTDENGDYVRSKWNDANSPIIVNSDTISIVVPTTVWVGGLSANTYSFTITNQDSTNVTSECSFYSADVTKLTTGSTYGRVITGLISGNTSVNIIHNDYPTQILASGVTSVIVGVVSTGMVFSPSAATILTGATYTASNFLVNAYGINIPVGHVVYTASNLLSGCTLNASTGALASTLNVTGSTTITATHQGATSVTPATIVVSITR